EKGTQRESILHGISRGLPALIRAQKLQKKAAKVGFDWPDVAPVLDKIREEANEIVAEIATGDAKAIAEEVGDLLFSVVNLARKLGVDAESALVAANAKFERRFGKVEEALAAQGRQPGECSLPELDAVWDQVKSGAI
ncbi:MAG: MazG family protein, partial [Candidatus Limnocylindrales bacterium]